jgi:hypothetical protein
MAACPLEGLVRSVASPQDRSVDLGFTSKTNAASDSSLNKHWKTARLKNGFVPAVEICGGSRAFGMVYLEHLYAT